ncbi:MAG: Macrolide export protein MacA [Lentisphaerae bacterium ADurb.BinA184]|nr:MAG: Macrolide export protein MacA [Lentisphaerae bacterium ADurb.BinA184]
MDSANGQRNGRRRRVRRWLLALVLLALAGGGYAGWREVERRRQAAADGQTRDRIHRIQRGHFTISLQMDGNLDAIERHMIKVENLNARFGLEVVEMVQDRAEVKKGDQLFRFSETKYKAEEDRLLVEMDDERTNLRLAEEDLAMTKASNLSAIKAAAGKLRTAQEALQRYLEQEAPQKKKDLARAVDAAELKVAQAEEKVTASRNQIADARMQGQDDNKLDSLDEQLTTAEKSVSQAQDELEKARAAVSAFKMYDHPQRTRQLREAVTEARMGMQRELVNASGNVIKAERQIENHHTRIRQLETQIREVRDAIEKLILRAPVDGIVSLGNPMRRQWQQPDEIKVGTNVSVNQVLASIPDMSKFMVEVNLPEENRSRIRTGLAAALTSKAIPDLVLSGTITDISPMAVNVVRWDNNSPKIYPTKISTDSADPRLMPGMTMQVEVVLEQVQDVLYAPIEAVYGREGKTYVRVRQLTGEAEREVTTGRVSNDYVELTAGVEEGDDVILHRVGDTRPAR